jgi:hypothetical protein
MPIKYAVEAHVLAPCDVSARPPPPTGLQQAPATFSRPSCDPFDTLWPLLCVSSTIRNIRYPLVLAAIERSKSATWCKPFKHRENWERTGLLLHGSTLLPFPTQGIENPRKRLSNRGILGPCAVGGLPQVQLQTLSRKYSCKSQPSLLLLRHAVPSTETMSVALCFVVLAALVQSDAFKRTAR